jgi:transposase-like protein
MQTLTAPTPENNLTDAQYKVLNYLLSGISISDAARAAGVHRNTVTNWRRQIPAFATLLNEALAERALLFREQIEALAFKAIEVLRTILHNEDASPSVRLRAALAVLKMAPPVQEPAESKLPELCTKPEKLPNPAQQGPADAERKKPCHCGSGVRYSLCCSPDSPVHPSRALLQTERTAAQPVQSAKMPVNEICGVEK